VNVLSVTDKETLLKQEDYLSNRESGGKSHHHDSINDEHKSVVKELEKEEFLSNLGLEFDRVILTHESEKDPQQSSRLILGAINALQPDIVVTGASIKKFSIFDNPQFVQMIERLNCPVIIMRNFTIPGINKVKTALMRLLGK
jgi:basic amino acid/polyamine antiporter, APA family